MIRWGSFLEVKRVSKMVKEVDEIMKTYEEDGTYKGTADKIGVARNTVKKYVKLYNAAREEEESEDQEENGAKNRRIEEMTHRPWELRLNELLKETMGQRRKKMRTKASTLYRNLADEGYKVSYSSVKRRVQAIKDQYTPRETFIRQEHPIGKDVEFDWGEVFFDYGCAEVKRFMGVFTFPHGMYRFARIYAHQSMLEVLDIHLKLFDHLGGVPKEIVYDNMKTVVITPGKKRFNPQMIQFSTYYGFSIRMCNVGKPNEKGSVENSVSFVRREAFSLKHTFRDDGDVNAYLEQKLEKMNRYTVYERTKTPFDAMEEEKSHFKQLPGSRWINAREESRIINKYSMISVDGNHYSVPDTFFPRKIAIRILVDKIELLNEQRCIGTHERLSGKGQYRLEITHYLETFKRKPGALAQSSALRAQANSLQQLFDHHYTKKPKAFIDILELLYQTSPRQLVALIERLQSQGIIPTADILKNLLEQKESIPAPALDTYHLDIPVKHEGLDTFDRLIVRNQG